MSGFTALFSRMNYIDRWGLMRNSRTETLAEHSAVTSCIAHVLASVAREEFGEDVRPETVAVAALYHDMSETLTGDMPTPVKYANSDIRDSYKKIERQAEENIRDMLPSSLRNTVGDYITGDVLSDRERKIVKAADKLSAYIKCVEERRSGNKEFETAELTTFEALKSVELKELDYFLEHFMPAYSLTLDQLMTSEEEEG